MTAGLGVFRGKTVLVTGHTGFKGSWLSLWLSDLGAKVVGLSLPPESQPNLFDQLGLKKLVDSRLGDIRDLAPVEKIVREIKPEIIFHLAAQPLVRLSYEKPDETFAVNVQGTVSVMEAARRAGTSRVFVAITTDKCYENRETLRPYREDDRLGGRDPYSASKACAELAVAAYRGSFFSKENDMSLSSARAGNVIGGGDWAKDRLAPDCARALAAGKDVVVRNPRSVRPWQHVLDPLSGYLALAALQWSEPRRYAQAWNFGPDQADARTTADVAELAVRAWGSGRWTPAEDFGKGEPHEAGLLTLDSGKARAELGWKPVYGVESAVEKTMAWYKAAQAKDFDALVFSREQIREYCAQLESCSTASGRSSAGTKAS